MCWNDLESANPNAPNLILCKVAGLNQQPVQEIGISSDSNWRVKPFQMAVSNNFWHEFELASFWLSLSCCQNQPFTCYDILAQKLLRNSEGGVNDVLNHCMLYFPLYTSQFCCYVISILLWGHYRGSYAYLSWNNYSNIFMREMKNKIENFFYSRCSCY